MLGKILEWLGFKKERKPEMVRKIKAREIHEEISKPRRVTKKPKAKKTKKEMVVSYLKRRKNPAKVEDIAKRVGATVQTTRRYLYYLAREGKVEKKDKGWVAK